MSVLTLNVDEVMRTLSAESSNPFVVHDKEVDIVRFAINSGFADIVLDGQVALRVMYQRPGETEVRAQTLTYYDTDGLHNYYDWQLSQSDLAKNGSLTVALCILDISGGEVSEWHTTPCAVRVLSTIHTDDSDEGDDTITPTVKERVAVLESMIQRVASGAPIVVASASDMTETDRIYVLKTDGKWYYHNGSAWVAGGEYGAVATDKSLTQDNIPADAEAVGDAIKELQDALDNLQIETDTTLSLDGKPADSKTVGDKINEISDDLTDINKSLYSDGDAVVIQAASSASPVLHSPSARIHVISTNNKIYTGSKNFVDLIDFAQGVFTDANSGVTISLNGTEMHIYGSPTKGFRFNPQTGEFYTDAFTNHPAVFSNFPNEEDVAYKLCFFEKDGYSMPSNIYLAVLKSDKTSIQSGALNGHSREFCMFQGQYIAIYSNFAISNIDIKFTIGLRLSKTPGTQDGGIEGVAKAQTGTTVITQPGYYECGEFTWTGTNTNYNARKTILLIQEDPLIKDHSIAWFGDSLSQLRELPNLVGDLLGITVYDCTFAGSPLTYGDPTKYQPTGFMSLVEQITQEDFTELSNAIDAQEAAGINVTEKRLHLATLQNLDFDTVTDIVLFAGTNDFDNDYVNATKFVNGFRTALTSLLTAYPHLMIYVFAPTWRGDKSEGVQTIPTMTDLVNLEKTVADDFSLPFYDLYHRSGINELTASIYLENDRLHPSARGDSLLANKCAKFIRSN